MAESGKILIYMQGLIFPATKEKIVNYAKNNNAPTDVVLILQNLTKVHFEELDELVAEIEAEDYFS